MLNRTSIEEANRHLQALYGRVSELESIAQEQHDALLAKDSFIQTKVQELSRQDILIQDLKNLLNEKDKLLSTKDKEIEELNHELELRNKELSILKQRNKALNDFMTLAPQLKSIMTEVETVVEYVSNIEDGSYADTNESSIDDGDINTDHAKDDSNLETDRNDSDGNLLNQIDRNCVRKHGGDKHASDYGGGMVNTTEINGKVMHSLTVVDTDASDLVKHSLTQHLVMNGQYSRDELMQHSGRLSKFSISEDDDNEEIKEAMDNSGQKEVYF